MAPEYDEDNVSLVLIVSFCLLVAIGISFNGFIITVNLNRWIKSPPLQSIDIIFTGLAIVRIILLILYILYDLSWLVSTSVINSYMTREDTMTLMMSVEFCSLWWASVLCVYYCVKITNYSNGFFRRLKMNISKMVPWLLLVSLIPSLFCSLPYRWYLFLTQSFNATGNFKVNGLETFVISLTGSIIPFLISCISVGLLIVSLLRHTRHLDCRGSSFSDAQCDVHLTVIWNMVSFLFFSVVYFLGSNLVFLSSTIESQPFTLLCSISYASFPSLHSISVIVSNRELKTALLTALRCTWIRGRALGR